MEIKKKLKAMKDEVVEFVDDNKGLFRGLAYGAFAGIVFGTLYGLTTGVRIGRSGWDFADEMIDECSMLVDDNLDVVAILPNRIIKEILDAHKKIQQ